MINKIMQTWEMFRDVNYVSPKPSDKYGFAIPRPPRADTNPMFNGQPWYHGPFFGAVDNTQKIMKKAK
ncbi:MAG: hypothetical protein C5B47_00255 [Verrucomicrobia bacterium]|nr:MAG: hypothetical protein C5B47_00255 [Verrucomicrobiota bacterium]